MADVVDTEVGLAGDFSVIGLCNVDSDWLRAVSDSVFQEAGEKGHSLHYVFPFPKRIAN